MSVRVILGPVLPRCARFSSMAALAMLTLLAWKVPGAWGATVVARNDALVDATDGVPCNCFAAGNQAAVWLSSSCRGDVVAVQLLWRSAGGGFPATVERAVVLSTPGTFPTPGEPLQTRAGEAAVIERPTLADGAVNELRSLDPEGTLPLRVPVTPETPFVVALEFADTTATPARPATLVYDTDGCQPGRNAIFGDGVWQDGCSHGLIGDLGIRAVVDCDGAQAAATGSRMGGVTILAVGILLAAALAIRALGKRARRA